MIACALSPFWASNSTAAETLQRISDYEQQKTYRSTVVVPIIDHAGRPLLVRHFTTGLWGLIQGRIEPTDPHPLAAGCREAYEESSLSSGAMAAVVPYLGHAWVEFIEPQLHSTGYSEGGYYVFVGIHLKPGADISMVPAPGEPQALLDRVWCSSLDQAIKIVREQPGVEKEKVRKRVKAKNELVIIPALESIYRPSSEWILELLGSIT